MSLKIWSVFLILLTHCINKGQLRKKTTTTTVATVETTEATASPSTRTYAFFVSIKSRCDGLAIFCMRAYRTGRICARTNYYNYETFKNYCMMDFVNCNEHYEVWQIVHMGDCFVYVPNEEFIYYGYMTDHFLDDYYATESYIPRLTSMNYE